MSISDKLKEVDEKIEKAKQAEEEAEEAKREEERQRERREEERRMKERKEEIRSIIMDPREELDEPHMYTINYSYSGGGGYGYGPRNDSGISEGDIIITERVKLLAEKINHLSLGDECAAFCHECTEIISISLSTKEMSDFEKLMLEGIRKKIELIKSSPEEEKEKKAKMILTDLVGGIRNLEVEVDDEHAALCSMAFPKKLGIIKMSDEIAKEEQKAKEEEQKAKEEAMSRYKKEHPIGYTFSKIKAALKNRSRGKE